MNQTLRVSPRSLAGCFATCIGISAFLISPALAQVNGPGPSPSSSFDTVLNLPGDEDVITGLVPESVGGEPGQTVQLNVSDGGRVGTDFDALSGSEVNVSGGVLNVGFDAKSGSEVNLSSGAIGGGFDAETGSVVTISGGTVGQAFSAFSGSEVTISGGTISRFFDAESGSVVNISGGAIGAGFHAKFGSDVTISGGSFDINFRADSGSVVRISGGTFGDNFSATGGDVELIGGEFRLNGADFTDSTISLADDDVFTGTLADGSSYIFGSQIDNFFRQSASLTNVTLTAAPLPAADLNPIVINAPSVSGPSGLRAGQTLTLLSGGSLRADFAVVDAALNVEDGIVGSRLKVFNSQVNISGGAIGRCFDVLSGSEVNISGGTLSSFFGVFSGGVANISGGSTGRVDVFSGGELNVSGGSLFDVDADSGSEVNITDGTIRSGISANSGSVVNISGGTFDESGRPVVFDFGSLVNISGGTFSGTVIAGSELNISGGSFEGIFAALSGSEVNISGSDFLIDGVALNSLQLGQAFTIADRDVTLSGVLDDGQPFSFELNSVNSFTDDSFDPEATLTVTLTAPFLLGDVNQDGAANFEDIGPFIMVLQSGSFLEQADTNEDGVVDFEDIESFTAILACQILFMRKNLTQTGRRKVSNPEPLRLRVRLISVWTVFA